MLIEGQRLGDFEILDHIGQGGMGAVFKARQISLERIVAIKTLKPFVSDDPDYVARFHQEAVAAASLNHPNLVQVYAAGENGGFHYFAMEYIEGESAHRRLDREGRLEPLEAIAIATHVSVALEHGWRKAGLIHRDIKPDNIFLSIEGEVKLGDLGLAKSEGQRLATKTGAAIGTPHYICPEQAEGKKDIDLRADIYSLGCTLYHLLGGRPPYVAESAMAIMLKHVSAPVPDLREVWPECPEELAALVAKMMQKAPADRLQTHAEVSAALRRIYDSLCGNSVPNAVGVAPTATGRRSAIPQGVAAKKSTLPLYAAIAGGAALVMAAFFFVRSQSRDGRIANTPAPENAASSATHRDSGASPAVASPSGSPARRDEEASATPATDASQSPKGVESFAGHRYQVMFIPLTWEDARARAASLGGYLVTINSQEEAEWISKTYGRRMKNSGSALWLGGFAQGKDKPWQWVTGEPWGDASWHEGQPDYSGGDNASYVLEYVNLNGRLAWRAAVKGAKKMYYIVEWDDTNSDKLIPAVGTQPAVTSTAPTNNAPHVNSPTATTAASTPKPATEVEKWFAQVDGPHQETYQKQASQPFEAGLADLRLRYLAALDAAIARASAANQLAEALAWRTERQAFAQAQNIAADDTGVSPEVVSLRVAFRQQLLKLDQTRLAKANALFAEYDPILTKYQSLLTQRGRLDDALLLKNKRDELTRAWLAPSPLLAAAAANPEPRAPLAQAEAFKQAKHVESANSEPPANTIKAADTSFANATKETPYENPLGMKFVPVPISRGATAGQRVLFCIWDTRVQDYAAYAKSRNVDDSWKKQDMKGLPVSREPLYPVVGVSWEDAQAFCKWLTETETAGGRLPKGAEYRLPTDEEWSIAVGLPPERGATPQERDRMGSVVDFPWGKGYPPKVKVGNYSDAALLKVDSTAAIIGGYTDGYTTTSPVGSFHANKYGLCDMGGNVWQWCADWFDASQTDRSARGASWFSSAATTLRSSARKNFEPTARTGQMGFRCVIGTATARPPTSN